MPLQSEIIQRLSADNSNYRSVMNQSERIADTTGKSILKKLDLKDAARTLAVAVGLSVDKIAERVARFAIGWSEADEEAMKKTVEASEKAADKQIEALEKVKAAHEKDMQERLDQHSRELDIIRDANEKSRAIELQREKDQRQKIFDIQREADERHLQAIKDNIELLALQAKARRGLSDEERARLNVLKAETTELDRQEQITTLLSLNKRTPQEEALLQTLIKQSSQYKSSLSTVTEIKNKVAEIGPEIESNTKKWEGFVLAMKTTGRGDDQLSDRELERKIDNISRDLAMRSALALGTNQGPLAFSTNPDAIAESVLKPSLARSRDQLDFRRNVRRQVAAFGEDQAFRMNPNLTEQQFREIQQMAPAVRDVVDELKLLRGQLNKGVPTVLFGNDTAA